MSIGVQSYPELYTLLLGWDLYDKLWALLTQTGLAYIPFIGMILRNVAQSYATHHGSENALRAMEMHIIATLLLIFFAVAPCIPLDAHTVAYSPLCGNNNTYHPGSTGTTYDKAFAIPDDDIRVPIWWYAVISISEGMTRAASTMVACVPDLRKMVTEVHMAEISDPELKSEVQDFATMCYAPARTQFFNDSKANNNTNMSRIQDDVKQYGVEDTEWLGSHAFSDVYYQTIQAGRTVPGFAYDASQDINADTDQANPPTYGTPSCYAWWNDSENGLKSRLYQILPKTFTDEFKDYVNTDSAHDDVIKRIITGVPKGDAGYASANDTLSDHGYAYLVSAVGTLMHQGEEYPKIYAAGQAAPIIQALLLLMVYVFLPFALVFSGYTPSAFISGALMIFSLIFWTFIWHLVSWTDKALMQALYVGWFTKQGAGATLTDMIIGSLVIAAPLFWFTLMGAMGIAVGDVVSSAVFRLNTIGEKAANAGSKVVKNVATTAAKAITKM